VDGRRIVAVDDIDRAMGGPLGGDRQLERRRDEFRCRERRNRHCNERAHVYGAVVVIVFERLSGLGVLRWCAVTRHVSVNGLTIVVRRRVVIGMRMDE
jgi:hypothetical protein